uniref:Uncharacterized protein n=1 Tax=Romanomermis culicivorax TaxID=13658 RepID=A0A915I113_ROMCU
MDAIVSAQNTSLHVWIDGLPVMYCSMQRIFFENVHLQHIGTKIVLEIAEDEDITQPLTKVVPSFQVSLCNRKVAAKVEPTCEGRSFVEVNADMLGTLLLSKSRSGSRSTCKLTNEPRYSILGLVMREEVLNSLFE